MKLSNKLPPILQSSRILINGCFFIINVRQYYNMRGYNMMMMIQMILLFGVTEKLLSGNAPLRRVSGTIRAGSVAKSGE